MQVFQAVLRGIGLAANSQNLLRQSISAHAFVHWSGLEVGFDNGPGELGKGAALDPVETSFACG